MWQLLQCQWVCVRPHDRRSHSVTRHHTRYQLTWFFTRDGKGIPGNLKVDSNQTRKGDQYQLGWSQMCLLYIREPVTAVKTQSLSSAWTRRWTMFSFINMWQTDSWYSRWLPIKEKATESERSVISLFIPLHFFRGPKTCKSNSCFQLWSRMRRHWTGGHCHWQLFPTNKGYYGPS